MMEDPYRGLMPYQEGDADYFFGRDTERKIIASNLSASRFTVLYGPSGVGKTSALRAGVMRDLRQEAAHNLDQLGLPEFAVAWLSEWRGDPVAALDQAIRDGVAKAMAGDGGPVSGDTPIEKLAAWNERLNGEIFLILDQFEEYFLYHPDDGPESFGALLPKIITNTSLEVNILLSLRDDALSQLDRFKGRIPDLFSNYLRIDRLTRDAGRMAIEQPVKQWNHERAATEGEVKIDPDLTNAVLDQVRTGQQGFGERGRGRAHQAGGPAEEIETPFLQLVMQRIWSEERAAGSDKLRLETLNELGGASDILRTHLGRVLEQLPGEEQHVARSIFYYLVTPSGAKIAHSAADLASYTDCDQDVISTVLKRLCRRESRILREVAAPDDTSGNRYEIYHDVLGSAILEWQRETKVAEQTQRILDEQATASAQRQRVIRKTARLNMLVVSFGAVLLIGFYVMRSFQMEVAQRDLLLELEDLQSEITKTQTASLGGIDRPAGTSDAGGGKLAAYSPNDLSLAWELQDILKDEIDAGIVSISTDGSKTTIRLTSTDMFASGSDQIDPGAVEKIVILARALANTPGRILVTGHTDSSPSSARGKFKTNVELSFARAEAVASILRSNVLTPSRVFAEGKGDQEPIADNATAEGRALNRRVEISLLGGY